MVTACPGQAALGTADASLGDVNPLGVHVEAFVEGEEDSRDEEEEVMPYALLRPTVEPYYT